MPGLPVGPKLNSSAPTLNLPVDKIVTAFWASLVLVVPVDRVISNPIFSKLVRSGLIATLTGTLMAVSSFPRALLKLTSGATAVALKLTVTLFSTIPDALVKSLLTPCNRTLLPNKPFFAKIVMLSLTLVLDSWAWVKE